MSKQSKDAVRSWEVGVGHEVAPQIPPAEFETTDLSPTAVGDIDAIVIPVLVGDDVPVIGPGGDAVEAETGLDLVEQMQAAGHTGAVGETLRVPLNGSERSLLLVGAGSGTPAECRRAAATMARELASSASIVSTLAALGGADVLSAVVEGVVLARPTFSMRSNGQVAVLQRVVLAGCAPADGALARSVATAHAAALARALSTVPSNIKSPAWLAEQAVLQAERARLDVEVWDESRMEKEGFGGVLAVGSGSASPPRFVQMTYTPPRAKRSTPHVVLVGKGITFDSGGLSIKPGEGMATMKRDMTGAAVVLSVLSALTALECPVKVTGLLPIAENAVGAASMRPG
ncbi:MAG: leucyl aminopeptidase family protein, partial [Marmoricola sp.]